MKPLSHRIRLALIAVVVFGLGLMSVMEFTDWHVLQAVTLNGERVGDPEADLGFRNGASVLDQPLGAVAAQLLADDKTAKVDISYSFPASLHVETNRFTPVGLMLDRNNGRLFGLNVQGRVVPLSPDRRNWEHPVITGTTAGGILELCSDPRVGLLAPQLVRLADDNLDLYRLIDEIDLRSATFATVTISGLPYQLKVQAASFAKQTLGFVRFLEKYESEADSARMIDLRFANMIVQETQRN
jgi:hypothetical protein